MHSELNFHITGGAHPLSNSDHPEQLIRRSDTRISEVAKKNIHGLTADTVHNKRLGLVEVIKLGAGLVIFSLHSLASLVIKVQKAIVKHFNLPVEFNEKNIHISDSDREKLQKLQGVLSDEWSDNDSILKEIDSYNPATKLQSTSGMHEPLQRSLLLLKANVEAYMAAFPEGKDVLLEALKSDKFKTLLGHLEQECQANPSAPELIVDFFSKEVLSGNEKKTKTLESETLKAWGRMLPSSKERSFKLTLNKEVSNFEETSVHLSPIMGAEYLEKINTDKFSSQIKHIRTHHTGIRPSELRGNAEVQGMITNGHIHSLSLNGEPVETVYRSGAFAVHHSGFKGEDRLHLSIAQALPKITRSIQDMARNPEKAEVASKTGAFLHVEQSFLSDLEKKEETMIQDMNRAIEHIREHALIKFGHQEGIEISKDGAIIITLSSENVEETLIEKEPRGGYEIKALFFTHGVNEFQSIGLARGKTPKTQNTINAKSLKLLKDYALKANLEKSEAVETFESYFSPSNSPNRRGKDLQGMRAIRNAVYVLGGNRGVVCKSGKDRTGSEVNETLTEATTRNMTGKTSEEELKEFQSALRRELDGGISYVITGDNTMKSNAYAFNAGQHNTLPEDWKPSEDLCGSRNS